jgi:hypothetical protein
MLSQGTHESLIAEALMQGKSCRATIDTGTSVTIAQSDIVSGQPQRKTNRAYVLQTASGESIPLMMEALVGLTVGRRALRFWVFVADVKDEFIIGLDECGLQRVRFPATTESGGGDIMET